MMSSNKPYLIRAFYDWIVDNECSPYLVVDTTRPGVDVPEEFISDGQIVLNIKPSAVQNLQLSNDLISFHARFSGQPHSIYVPTSAVTAIYARENGAGMVFTADEEQHERQEDADNTVNEPSPKFGVVENNELSDSSGEESKTEATDNTKPKGPHLTVVK